MFSLFFQIVILHEITGELITVVEETISFGCEVSCP